MKEEIEAIAKNHTWDIVILPKGKYYVSYKCMYKIKYENDGSIGHHKARLIVKSYTQTYGKDRKETFAPVVKMSTVCVLMSIAVNCDWPLFQMNVNNIFL